MSTIIEPWSLGEIAAAVEGEIIAGSPETMIHGVTTDSRSIPPRSLFVALRGENHDAHDYIGVVAGAGARAALVDHSRPTRLDFGLVRVSDTTRALGRLAARYRARFKQHVVAITGSSGKTTTKNFLAAISRRRFRTVATEGNLNNHIGVPLTLLSIGRATEHAVVEMGMSNRGEIAYLASLVEPHIGVITSIGPAHLETLRDIDGVIQAKAELIEELNRLNGVVILNADMPFFENLARRVTCRLVTVGESATADVRIREIEAVGYAPASFVYRGLRVTLRLSGRHVISNAILAAAAAEALGVDPVDIVAGLEEVYPSPGRSSIVRIDGVTVVDDAYNANPLSFRAAIAQLASEPANRRVVVMADMLELGMDSARYHAELGTLIREAGIDILLHRGEGAAHTAEAASGTRAIACDSNEMMEETLTGLLLPGDVVLFKASHGMKIYEVARRVTESLRRRGTMRRSDVVAIKR